MRFFTLAIIGLLVACAGPKLPASNSADVRYDGRNQTLQVMVSSLQPPTAVALVANCPATSGTDPSATPGIDPLLNVSLFDWWDRFSAPTRFSCGVARSCGQAWPWATGVAGAQRA
jgi:hypothetical protein